VRVIGYVRVSTAEQADSGLGLEAQRAALQREAAHRGWTLTIITDEGRTGANLRRPGIRRALRLIAQGKADALAVAKLDRLSRSNADSAQLFYWFHEAGAALILLDFELDTSSPTGKLIATFMAGLAEWERDMIAARTKAALAALRAQGKPTGRPAVADHRELERRIKRMRDQGATYQAIADTLNREGVPTMRGGREWRISSVQAACGYVRPAKRRGRTTLPALQGRR
jgi:DNA invertase Pin-like site-specific DNA recombinase